MEEISIVYLVAGLSSRFGGKIKQFAKVGPKEETLIEYSLNQALPTGFTKIIFVIGDKTEKPFKEMFGNKYNGIPVQYAFQEYDPSLRDKPWGTMDAVCFAKNIINGPFVICNGDDLYGVEAFKILFNYLKNNKGSATIGYKLKEVLPEKDAVNRGIFTVNSDNTIKSIVETFNIKKSSMEAEGLSGEDLCSMNIFGFHLEHLGLFEECLTNFKKKNKTDRGVECLLPTELNNLIKEGKLIMNLYTTSGKWFGITNPGDEIKVREELRKLNNQL